MNFLLNIGLVASHLIAFGLGAAAVCAIVVAYLVSQGPRPEAEAYKHFLEKKVE